ncbi:MAG: PorV/PorQ family protein [Candidatus Marinimicrobia bacterium]|nr:PorV/PorQ family protein [Candidatus Neomarinimicrobiota bacterium]
MRKSIQIISVFALISLQTIQSQEIYRYGTTAANFLEIGIGSAGSAMGEAYVGVAQDLSSIYWNPAGLAYIKGSEAQFMMQPWIVDINTIFAGAAVNVPRIGTFAFGLTQIGYGDMKVTTLSHQNGTGENFTANELAASLSYARKLAEWFAFGATTKLIHSSIWHTSANAFAVDLGVSVQTGFFSLSDRQEDGLTIAMSIANYGTRMRYDGIDLLNPIDISEYENGNYGDVPGQFRTQEWELPLIFRIGGALKPISTRNHTLILAADALHPNNNTESVNIGAEYSINIPGTARVFVRSGYKGLYMDSSEYGMTGGAGVELFFMRNQSIAVDYAYKTMGLLGNVSAYTISMSF